MKKKIALLAFLLCFASWTPAGGGELLVEQWQAWMASGQLAKDHLRYSQAISLYRKAEGVAEKFGSRDLRLAKTLYMLSSCYDMHCDRRRAIEAAERADRIYEAALQWQLKQPPVDDTTESDWHTAEPVLSIWLDSMENLNTLIGLYRFTRQYDKALELLNAKVAAVQGGSGVDPLMKAEALTIYNDWMAMVRKRSY